MDVLRGASKLLQTGAKNNESKVESKGKGLGRTWTQKISDKVRGSVGKAIATAKEHFGPKTEIHADTPIGQPYNVVAKQSNLGSAETPISRPFDVVPQRSSLGSEGTQQTKAPTEQKTLSEKREALETSITKSEKKLFDHEESYRGKNKDAAYETQHNQLDLEIAGLKDQLADIKKEIRDNS